DMETMETTEEVSYVKKLEESRLDENARKMSSFCGCAVFDGHNGDNAAKFCTQQLPRIIAECVVSHPKHDTTDTTQNETKDNDNDNDKDKDKEKTESLKCAISAGSQTEMEWNKQHVCLPWDERIGLEKFDYICESIIHGFLVGEREFGKWADGKRCSSGAAGVFVLLDGQHLYVANIGDSKAVLCRCVNESVQAHQLTQTHKCSEFRLFFFFFFFEMGFFTSPLFF
ncbi:hypothetical protein RFI_19807, partial [Reticulomyxa filosa]